MFKTLKTGGTTEVRAWAGWLALVGSRPTTDSPHVDPTQERTRPGCIPPPPPTHPHSPTHPGLLSKAYSCGESRVLPLPALRLRVRVL